MTDETAQLHGEAFRFAIGIDMASGATDEAADRALSTVARKLDKTLSVEYTVNELITEASDPANLALMYIGEPRTRFVHVCFAAHASLPVLRRAFAQAGRHSGSGDAADRCFRSSMILTTASQQHAPNLSYPSIHHLSASHTHLPTYSTYTHTPHTHAR